MKPLYQVMPNKTIRGPGGRFIAKGMQMFAYLFVSFEGRADTNFRAIYNPAGKGAAYGISEPTYYARYLYQSHAYINAQLRDAYNVGVNLIRVDVEPATMFASVPYVDPVNGQTYPSDVDMLDDIIDTANEYGMVVQLQNANDSVDTAKNVAFLSFLAARYFERANVWINPANEVNGTNSAVNDPVVWAAEVRQYVLALRADIPGQPAGVKFTNPVCLDAPGWGERIDLIAGTLTTDPVFANDGNIVMQVHVYPQAGQANFVTAQLPTSTARWWQYRNQFAIIIGETGIDNFYGRYDPLLDAAIPSVDPVAWGKMQSFQIDFLSWCDARCKDAALNGVIGHHWYGYIPGLTMHEDNTMHKVDGSWTTWGSIFKNKFLSPAL